MNNKYYQQGDVILVKINNLPDNLNKAKNRVVQEGEHTGHAHRFVSEDASNATLFSGEGGAKFLRIVNGGATITHEEHDPQVIEEGEYEVRIVREKDIFSKLVRKVVD